MLGTLAVFFTYRAGMAAVSPGAALVGAAVVAFNRTAMEQTSHVSSDATTAAAGAAALWGAVSMLRFRATWAYHVSAMAAGAAAAFKYTSLVLFVLPVAAHVLTSRPRSSPCMMFPAFLDPPKFLSDQAAAKEFYRQAPMGTAGKARSVVVRTLALLDAGRIDGADAAGSPTVPPYAPAATGLPVAAAAVVGAVALARSRPRLLIVLLAPVAAFHLLIGPATTFYFTRHLLPALPSLALLAGFGVVHAASWAAPLAGRAAGPAKSRAALTASLALGLAVVVPPAAVNCPVLHAFAVRPDTRSALSAMMLKSCRPAPESS